ncbi:hypothetical protein HY605_01910, partial [Candidatus Peregrinibacteria bacterium]|nr:hypothetical protein [Candidatus Peregrinibacteria bacterium]
MASKPSLKPSLLKKEFSTLFSPLRIHSDILESDKRFALYKFTMVFFPNLGPSILNLLLDMERHSQKICASMSPDEREKLIKELEGITVDIRYAIKEKDRELVVLPIKISPAEVLKNVTLTKAGSRYDEKMQEEINK